MDFLFSVKNFLISCVTEEWFWAVVAVVITLISFIMQMRKENEISRANFIYNISNDFGNNERILRVYQWLEKCRRENYKVNNYRELLMTTENDIYNFEDDELSIDFIDVDTYVNHFEAVYVILHSVNIKSIDELFQQRFLSFMFNPYVQKEELFECFGPDANDFALLKIWLKSIYKRNKFSCKEWMDYLNVVTCGKFEFSEKQLNVTQKRAPLLYKAKVKKYLLNYVYNICNPKCQYGYYSFNRKIDTKEEERKVMRIILSNEVDKDEVSDLQQRVIDAMPNPEMYAPSTKEQIHTAINNPQDYLCLQICDGKKLVAFGMVILNPTEEQDINLDLKKYGLPYTDKNQCVLDTVFVDPDYRGFGMQSVLIQVLCRWSAMLGKRNIVATIHPENSFSEKNFSDNGFAKVTPSPIAKYGDERNVFAKNLSYKDTKADKNGTYTVYPYV